LRAVNWVDLLLAAIVLLGMWTGWQRGFVRAALFLVSMSVALLVAIVFYRYPAEWLQARVPSLNVWAAPAAFVILWLGGQLLLDLFAHAVIAGLPRALHASLVNRVLGVLPGAANGAIQAAVLAIVLLTVPWLEPVSAAARESEFAGRLSEPADWAERQLMPIFDPAVRRTMQALTVPVGSHHTVQLPFKVAQARPRPDLEAQMLELINAERTQRGLQALAADPQATAVARAHSRDMLARGYFSHFTPEGGSLTERLRQAEVPFLLAGENLALSRTLVAAHQGLMDSPGHRANILRPQFNRVAIGVLDAGIHGLMITQDFRN
jgi:uncharacterized protein YkwD